MKMVIASHEQRLKRRDLANTKQKRIEDLKRLIGDFLSVVDETCGECDCTSLLVKRARSIIEKQGL
jgi:hypothetical protein